MNFIKKVIPLEDFKKTIQRFPFSAICSLFLFGLIVLNAHGIISIKDEAAIYSRLMLLAAYGFFWFGLARLITEGMGWSRRQERMLAYGGFALLAGFVFFSSGFSLLWLLGLMIPALLLGISVGPYIKSSDDLSYWFYNRQVWQGASMSIVAGLLLGAGISASLLSIKYLFGISIEDVIYADVWILSAIIFTPLYALTWVPERHRYTEADCHAPPQLAFILNWVLAPLVVLYMLILYAYFFKVALVWELPRGQISTMVMLFGGVGVATYQAGWPLQNSGGIFLRILYRFFFPALIVPVIMQVLAIYMRIEQYGVTEQRYLVAVSALWFAILAVLYTVKKPPLKVMPSILAVMLLVAALGPLSAPNVAVRSQVDRLEALLLEGDILVDGKIVKPEKTVSFENRKNISSIVEFLCKRKKIENLKPWIDEFPSDIYTGSRNDNLQRITDLMGFEYVNAYQRKRDISTENFNLNSPRSKITDVQGFRILYESQRVQAYKKEPVEKGQRGWELRGDEAEKITAYYQDGLFYVGAPNQGVIEFDVEAYALSEFNKNPSQDRRELVMEHRKGNLHVRLLFQNINLIREIDEGQEDSPYHLNSFSFSALVNY